MLTAIQLYYEIKPQNILNCWTVFYQFISLHVFSWCRSYVGYDYSFFSFYIESYNYVQELMLLYFLH